LSPGQTSIGGEASELRFRIERAAAKQLSLNRWIQMWCSRFLLFALVVFGCTLGQTQEFGAATLVGVPPAVAITPEPPPILTIYKRVDEVNLVLSATNTKGRFVRDLNPSDLVISDNGEPPDRITFFQTQTDLPLRVALVIDTSDSISFRFDFELKSAKGFLKQILRPDNDQALIVGFNQTATLVQPLTSDLASLNHGLKSLKARGETALFDAIALASDQLRPVAAEAVPVRRAIVLVTDGEENSSRITLGQAIEHVLRAEAVIYVLNIKRDRVTKEDIAGDRIITTLANATGGVVLQSQEAGDMQASFRKIEQELRSQYALGYRPQHLIGSFFRSIQIFGPDGIRIRCREGYYPH